jgi:hypothetical protein
VAHKHLTDVRDGEEMWYFDIIFLVENKLQQCVKKLNSTALISAKFWVRWEVWGFIPNMDMLMFCSRSENVFLCCI